MHVFYYSDTDSPLGRLILATEQDRLVALGPAATDGQGPDWLQRVLKSAAPFHLVYNAQTPLHAAIIRAVMALCHGQPVTLPRLELFGSDFQKRVWQALLDIPPGCTARPKEIARRIGSPKAVRAVEAAVEANPIHLFVPCHRVTADDEGLHSPDRGSMRAQLLAQERRWAA